VTPIAKTAAGKLVPNPNVMLELGHAMKAIGTDPIILVANSVYLGAPEGLPFDMRHRRAPIMFKLNEDDDKGAFAKARSKLVSDLTDAIKLNLSAVLGQRDAKKQFDLVNSRPDDPSSWLPDPEIVEHRDFFGEAAERRWTVDHRARSYLRVAPAGWRDGIPNRKRVQELKDYLWPMGRYTRSDGGPNSLGVVYVGVRPGCVDAIHTASQWFQQSGELWTFDGGIAGFEPEPAALATHLLIRQWGVSLQRHLKFFALVGAKGPFRVEAGVTGLEGTTWPGSLKSERVAAVDPKAIQVATARNWDTEQIAAFVTQAFNKVCDAYDRPHASILQIAPISNLSE
jgi:hypothetical protein